MIRWVGARASVRGERHRRREEPNEDHGTISALEGGMVIAVADGHGSPRCPRAATGAAFATAAAVEVLTGDVADDTLAGALVQAWRRRVDDDLDVRPSSATERDLVGHDLRVLYGSTLLAARATQDALVLAQLGDGDVLLGRRSRPHSADLPFPVGASRVLTATDSLSMPDASENVRVRRVELDGDKVDLVMLCTDGLDFAYEDADWHDTAMADLLARLPDLDTSRLDDELRRWCEPPARVGGDDTTLALLVRDDLLATPGPSGT